MTQDMRIVGRIAICVVLFSNLGPAEAAPNSIEERLVDAKTYLLDQRYTNAISVLTELTKDEAGAQDPRVWLLLGRAHFKKRQLDDAGRAMTKARQRGAKPEDLPDQKWVGPLLAMFEQSAGAVVIEWKEDRRLLFEWSPVSRMLGDNKRILLKMVQEGAEPGTPLLKRSNVEFFLPAGRHTLGEYEVDVEPGAVANVDGKKMKILNTLPLPPPSDDGPVSVVVTGGREGEEESWWERNALWVGLVGGGLLIAAATTGALVACCTESDEVQITGFSPAIR